jgi:hypothetical protein
MTHYCQYWRALFRRRRDHFLRNGRLARGRTDGEICVRMAKFACEMSTLIACLHPRQCRTLITDALITSTNAPVDEIVLPMRSYIPPNQIGDMRLCRKVIQINSNLVALWAGDYDEAYHFAERAMKWFRGDANSKA